MKHYGTWILGLSIACVLPLHSVSAQQAFDTPERAAQALVDAGRADDSARVAEILGKDAHDIIASGDPVYDKELKAGFIAAYDDAHGIEREGDNKAILAVGQGDWPFAIPIIRRNDGWWVFDLAAGKRELLMRRIGFNELNVIQACLGYVSAQNEYADMSRKRTGIPAYAQYIVSHPGKKDGLFWPDNDAQGESPLGQFMAYAAMEGYTNTGKQTPYHGYYYKILTRQGANAGGGQFDYIADGKMIGGFALIAWPAKYRNSGVVTFIVNHDGVVYEKDLGADTAKIAAKVTSFDPDKTWRQVPPGLAIALETKQ